MGGIIFDTTLVNWKDTREQLDRTLIGTVDGIFDKVRKAGIK